MVVAVVATSAPESDAPGCDRCAVERAGLEESLALALAESDRERVSQLREHLAALEHEERAA